MSALEEKLLQQIKFAGLPEPEREFRFHPVRRWRFDFYYPERKLAVEVEGGTYMAGGAHTRGAHFDSDAEKYFEANMMGITVVRVSTKMISSGKALEFIKRAIDRADEVNA